MVGISVLLCKFNWLNANAVFGRDSAYLAGKMLEKALKRVGKHPARRPGGSADRSSVVAFRI
jgi:hypothetical protein